ncbi:The GLUG motif-containing protein [Janthinobacterium sp. 551a]|nr:The GLUG motif-containing protein [Janthinobacterium sp. 551a]
MLNVAINAGAVGALVNNGGLIQADGGSVLLSAQAAGDLLKTVVNNTGVIEAHSIDTRGGTIKLLGDMQSGTVNAAGTLDASAPAGGNGGFIDTSAAHVNIDDALKVTTASKQGLAGTWLIDPTDFNIAARGGDMTGAFLSNSLKSGNVQIQSVSGGSGTQGNINVNDTISWSANKLTLTAQNNININKSMRGSGTASLALEYGQQAGASGNSSRYNIASSATVDLPTGNNFSTKLGSNGIVTTYKVINSLGAANSVTGNDLQGINGALSGNYVLGSNIDASSTSGWVGGGFSPIGRGDAPLGAGNATPFTGNFDGLGHVITGLTISRANAAVGLFGVIGSGASVSNMGLEGGSVSGSSPNYLGDFASAGMLAGMNRGLVNNVYSTGAVNGSGYSYIGGLVGRNNGTISNSRAGGAVVIAGYYGGGGLVGNNAAGAVVTNSSAFGTVSSADAGSVGGLVGFNYGLISKSFASTIVSGGQRAGGLTAYNRYQGTGPSQGVEYSYATGTVTGHTNVGGLVGENDNAKISNSYSTSTVTGTPGNGAAGDIVGGLVGFNQTGGTIVNSYATGNVSGSANVGGVVGWNNNTSGSGGVRSTLTNVYSSGKVTGVTNVGGVAGQNGAPNGIVNGIYNTTLNAGPGVGLNSGTATITGLTSTQMKSTSNFTGFNFSTTGGALGNNWVMVNTDGSFNSDTGSGATLPMLASEWSNTITSAHQLQLMGLSLTAQYVLANDIAAAGTASTASDVWGSTGFIPVGSSASAFTGRLDGTGHIISNLNIYKSGVAGVGLFGVVGGGGVITNVGLSGGSVAGGDGTGALVGTNGGSISGSFATSAVTGANNVGGLVGTNTGSVNDSYASGAVTGSSGAGGLAGSNSGSVATSYANGSVSGAGGGLVGTGAGSVTGSFWDSTVSGKINSAGGTGLSTAQLKTLANYSGAGWDLGQMWVAYDGQSAPFLRSFMKEIVVSVSTNTKVYDGVAYAGGANSVSYSRVYDNTILLGTPVYTGSAAGAVNAGTYAVSASGLYSTNGQSGYAVTYVDGGLVITPKSVTLSGAAVAGKVYDGTTTATITGTLNGVLAGDLANVSSTVGGTYASKNAGSNITVTTNASLGGSAGGNYALVPVAGLKGNISQATISGVTGIVAGNKTYDGTTAASLNTAGASFGGMVGGDNLTVSGASGNFDNKNAGNSKTVTINGLTLGGVDAGNYTLASSTASTTANISKATISGVTGIVAGNKVYDSTRDVSLNTTGASFTNMVNGDNLTVAGASGIFDNKNAGNGKTVTISGITLGGEDAGNYNLSDTAASATANISKATISGVTGIVAGNKVYDSTRDASLNTAGASITDMINGDSLTVAGASGIFDNKNAGNGKTVTISGITLGGADAGNYNLTNTSASATADISKATIASVNGIVAGNKVYDGTTAASLNTVGVTFDGKFAGDNLTVSNAVGAFSDKNVSNGKTVNVTGIVLGGTDAGNYSLTLDTASSLGNISAKTLTLSGLNGNKVYDGTADATLSGGTLNGLVNSETLAFTAQGSYNNKDAGTGKAITVNGVTLSDGTGLASNYTLAAPADLTGDIAKATISGITGLSALDKIYNGNLNVSLSPALAVINGKIAGDNVQLFSASGAFTDKNVGANKAVNITDITLSGSDVGNYNFVNNTATATASITPKAVTLSGVTASNKIYDGTMAAVLSGGSLNGVVSGETLNFSGGIGTFSDKNAGTNKVVTISGIVLQDGIGSASNYTFTSPGNVNANISKATISGVSNVGVNNKVYDSLTDATLTGTATFDGIIGSDSLTVAGTGAFGDKNAGTGKAVSVSGITLGGADAGNYNLASDVSSGTANIAKASISSVSNVGISNKTYDGSKTAVLNGTATFNGIFGADSLSVAGSGEFSDKNAGNGKTVTVSGITLGGADAGNYILGSDISSGTANIAKANLGSVSNVGVNNKVYDGLSDASLTGTATFNGIIGGDSLSVAGTGVFSDKNAAAGKNVTVSGITLGGTDAGNYNLVSNISSGTADITAKALTLTGQVAGNKVYDGNAVAQLTGGSLVGLVGGETLTIGGQTAAFSDKNAGNAKTVTVSGTILLDGSGSASNYTVSDPTGLTASITPKALTVAGQVAGNKVYDGNALAQLIGGSLVGLVGGETLTIGGQTAAFSDKNAGNGKAVTISGTTLLDGSGSASNYTVSNPTGLTASITPKALTVAGQVAGNKVYDGNVVAQLNGGSLIGLVGGETLTIGGQTAAFSDKNAGNAKAVTVSGTTLLDGSGSASNYTVSDPTGLTASITPKALTVAGQVAGNKVYDGNAVAQLTGGSLVGLVGGETLTIGGQTATFSDKNAGNAKTVTVSGTTLLDGSGSASNYTVSDPTGLTASITPKALTVAGQVAGNKVYDGNAVAQLTGGSLVGLVGGETLTIGGQTAAFSDKNAGNAKTVTVSGTTLLDGSGSASNYTVSDPTGLTASITPKALTVAGQVAGNKVYDGNVVAQLNGGSLVGLVGGETLTIGGQTAAFSDKNAGNAKTVTVTGTTLLDTATGLAGNYTVSNPTGLTASITPKALTVAGQVAGNKVYDGNALAQLTGGSLVGLVGGETLTIGGQTAAFSDKNAGNAKTVTVTGTTLLDTATGLAGNYTVSNPTGLTASITPKALTVGATAANKVYDATTGATVNLRDDRIAGDQLSIATNGATFADKNAGQGKTVTVGGIRLAGADAGNYVVNGTAVTTANIAQAQLTVKADNAEKSQGQPNPLFSASYTGLLGSDTVASELTGNLLLSTSATTGSSSGNYLITASGQTSVNYALDYVDGVLKVNPTEALQSAVAAAVASVVVAPSQGNMVQADQVSTGETVALATPVGEKGGATVLAPVAVPLNGNTVTNVLPGLRLSVINQGVLLPPELGGNADLAK